MSDRLRRIAERMRNSIRLYKQNNIEFADLLANLNFSASNIEQFDNDWKGSLDSKIFTLEEIYASEMYNNEIHKSNKNYLQNNNDLLKKIIECVNSIDQQLIEAIEMYKKTSDKSICEIAVKLNEGWVMCPDCSGAWKIQSCDRMIICPICDKAFHNPYSNNSSNS